MNKELNSNKITLAWLNSVNGISNRKIEKLLEYFGGVDEIWDNFEGERNKLTLLKPEILYNLSKTKKGFGEKLYIKLKEESAFLVTYFDDEYPKKLKNIDGAPYILYYKGNLESVSNTSVAIVGSRKATEYGMWAAEKFTKELSELGVTIISGLANGIDTVAHKTAIKYNAHTIGVIGCGIDLVYPKKNEALYQKIIDYNGAVISEYPFGMQPMPSNFPDRNRIISGLSDGVLVIEAQEKSGTLITAGHAANQGREIFAVPGNIDSLFSKGTNLLIKDGAKIVTCVADIIEEIPELRKVIDNNKKEKNNNLILNDDELKIVKLLLLNISTLYEMSDNTDMEIGEILGVLTILELKGIVRKASGERYFLNK
ncbi:DNA processing protein [Sedimentibacter acidaminivorans]|uniref:DNA processing protein n=1 Tax=Sedimentibacter acidaminivorans TaxID=913099 RepID=A0ABS4GI42_9FIRM|nr:DNA-processing protein DprA [Sedimentibacter acidaminivorans]MBP1927373.1 DNA processing protein [Sedimentibacter acidaminivorans]